MTTRSLSRTAFFTAVSKGAEGVGSVLATLIVARSLGPAGYGVYAQVVSAVMLLWPLVDMGLDHIVVREVVAGADRGRILASGLAVRGLAGMTFGAVAIGWSLWGRELGLPTALAVVNILLVRQVSNLVCRALFLGVERVENDAVVTIIGQVLRLGGLVVATRLGWGLIGVLALPIAAELAQALLGFALARRFLSPLRVTRGAMRHLVHEGLPILIRLVLVTAYFNIDNVLLGRFLSSEEVGLFAAPFRLVVGVVTVVVPTAWALLPSLVRARHGRDSHDLMRRVGPLASVATCLVGGAFVIGAGGLMGLTFGPIPSLPQAVSCLRLLAVLPALHTVAYLMELELLAGGRQGRALVGAGPALAVKILLDVWLARSLGPLAGAASSVAADVLRVLLLAAVARSAWMAHAALPIAVLGAVVAVGSFGGGR